MSPWFLFHQGKGLGLVYGNSTLRNARECGLAPKIIRALVDTGANILRIPPALATELQLDEVEKREVVWRMAPSTGRFASGPAEPSPQRPRHLLMALDPDRT